MQYTIADFAIVWMLAIRFSMDLLKLMRSFVAVADAESFSKAARALGISPAAITRDVAALENHLGARLLTRTTRVVRATPEGTLYCNHAKRILADVTEAGAAIRDRHGQLVGPVSVTAPVAFGQLHVGPLLFTFANNNPAVTLTALFVDRIVDLVEEGIDVAVRIAQLPDSTASASRVGEVRRRLCAAPKYLAEHGRPGSPSEVNNHHAIVTTQTSVPWRLQHKGRLATVHPKPRFVTSTVEAALTAAEAGLGLVWLFSYQVETAVAAGRLVPLLVDCEPPGVPVHVVHRAGRTRPQRTTLLMDHLVKGLRKRLMG